MINTSGETVPRIALFIDFDNGQLGINRVLYALREKGVIILKKAYGDWGKFSQFRKVLAENGVDLVERPSIYAGGDKNGADIQLAVDALEACINNPNIDLFAIVSGDSDFLPLISRLQAYNKKVVVIGRRKTTSSVVMRNCNEYLAYENITLPSESAKKEPVKAPKEETEETIEEAFVLLRRAMTLLEDEDKTIDSSVLKQKMVQLNPTFDEKTYGFEQFKAFLAAAQKAKIIHIGKKESGNYPITPGRKGREPEEEKKTTTSKKRSVASTRKTTRSAKK